MEEEGYVHSGFRSPWLLAYVRKYRLNKKLLLVRDPRDIAVSYFFSMAKSHSLPQSGAARDAVLKLRDSAVAEDPSSYVIAGHVNEVFANLIAFGQHASVYPNMTVVRYEDIIFDKPALARAICDTMGAQVSPAALAQIAERHDLRPSSEQPDQHVRQVTPGNYRKHPVRRGAGLPRETLSHSFRTLRLRAHLRPFATPFDVGARPPQRAASLIGRFGLRMDHPISHQEAIVFAMVTMSAVDRKMTDAELRRIGEIVQTLPVFANFEAGRLVSLAETCGEILQEDDGLDTILDLIATCTPKSLHETAYALAVEVAAADLSIAREELRFLAMLRDRLGLEKLIVAALERGAQARHRKA